jgi:hypothetical protein
MVHECDSYDDFKASASSLVTVVDLLPRGVLHARKSLRNMFSYRKNTRRFNF